ncbi:MAG: transporter substrate-binding domain-containing protein [Eubacteriaceae bacterium]|nr:transporter substrate-binding domain-containing protein [Eubacteriaceae bacterium]
MSASISDRIKRVGLWLMICIIAASFCFSTHSNVYAKDKVIKVGYFQYAGYQESTDDYKYGYNYEYLQQIAQYNNWELEFKDESYSQCITDLKNGDIDIMGCVFKTSARQDHFAFPDYNCGYESLSLYVSRDKDMAYNDYSAMNGMKVGYLKGSKNYSDMKKFCSKHNIDFSSVALDSVDDICSGIKSGRIDAGLLGGVINRTDLKSVAQFALQPFYFVTSKNNTEVLSGLNDAMGQIKANDPNCESDLRSKYLNADSLPLVLTKSEQDYVNDLDHSITVVYNDDLPPIAMTSSSGDFDGISSDVFKIISKETGLRFKFVSLPSSDECMRYLNSHKNCIAANFCFDYNYAGQHDLALTQAYIDTPMAMVEKKRSGKAAGSDRIAITDLMGTYKYISEKNNDKILTYNSVEGCLDSVKSGKAKKAIITSYAADYYLNGRKYKDLECITVPDNGISICAAMSGNCNGTLKSIMEKSVRSITENQRNDIIINNTMSSQSMSLSTLIDRMPVWMILLVFLIFIACIIMLLLLLYMKKRSANSMERLLCNDRMTGLYTKYGFDKKALSLMDSFSSQDFTVVDMDIIDFREYNLMYGYEEGDALLEYLSRHIIEALKKDEIACHI